MDHNFSQSDFDDIVQSMDEDDTLKRFFSIRLRGSQVDDLDDIMSFLSTRSPVAAIRYALHKEAAYIRSHYKR